MYLGQVKASASVGSSSEEYVSNILDQKVFSLAKTLQNNCRPILMSKNTKCVPRENGYTYTDFEFSLDTENDDRPAKHLYRLSGTFDYLPPNPFDDPSIFDDNLFRSSSTKMSLQLDDGFGLRSDVLDVNNPCIPRSSISASVECTPSEYSIQRFKVNYDITSAGSIVVENVGAWETPGVAFSFARSISVSSNTEILYFDYGVQFPALGDVKISLVPSDPRLSVKSTTVTIPDCRN